jgi:hypothetical protein
MEITAWNNGSHNSSGAGYGFKLSLEDRNLYFDKEWPSIYLKLLGVSNPIEINISKDSFWGNTCIELISKEIGMWLRSRGFAPWPKGNPPKFEMVNKGHNLFEIIRVIA